MCARDGRVLSHTTALWQGLDVFNTRSGAFVARIGLSWPGIQAGAAAIRSDGEVGVQGLLGVAGHGVSLSNGSWFRGLGV